MRRRRIGEVIDGQFVVTDASGTKRLREILESRCAPIMGNSDRAFLESRHDTYGLDPTNRDRYLAQARAAGINPNGKVYCGQLGRPDDPAAWVSGLDDVRSACIRKGKGCEDLGIKEAEPREPEIVPLAEDLIQEGVKRELKRDPSLKQKPKKLKEVREKVIAVHGRQQ